MSNTITFKTSDSISSKISPIYYYHKEQQLRKANDEVSIIIKINDLDLWEKLNVKTMTKIKIKDSEWIWTARIPFGDIETILSLPYVLSIEYSQRVYII